MYCMLKPYRNSEVIKMINKSWLSNMLYQILFIFLVSAIFCGNLLADSHYVSPTGSAAWAQSTNISTPCSASTAMANAVADDVVYFRGGVYYVTYDGVGNWQAPGMYPAHSGTVGHYITFIAYAGEVPKIVGTSSSGDGNALCFGPYARNYIIFDGFESYGKYGDGSIMPGGIRVGSNNWTRGEPSTYKDSTGCIIRNCIAHGGTHIVGGGDNAPLLRIESVTDLLVQNCKFYMYTTSDWMSHDTNSNHCAIEIYYSTNVIIENCEVYNTPNPLYNKTGAGPYITYRYNYIHNNWLGFFNETGIVHRSYTIVHDNVIVNNGDSTMLDIAKPQTPANSDYFSFYNNTVYMNAAHACIGLDKTHYMNVYNNILINKSTSSSAYVLWSSANAGNTISTWDHNEYGTYCARFNPNPGVTYASLSAWRGSTALIGGTHPGTGDLTSDPKFVNSSGKLNTLADFALQSSSPCKGVGRNGVDMGANIDLVGVNPLKLPPPTPPTDTTPPAIPSGINVIIVQ